MIHTILIMILPQTYIIINRKKMHRILLHNSLIVFIFEYIHALIDSQDMDISKNKHNYWKSMKASTNLYQK